MMEGKRRILHVFLGFLLAFGSARAQSGIRVEVHHLRNNKGQVLLSLFREAGGFPDDAGKALHRASVRIQGQKAVYVFPALAPGRYAVAVLHDENGDQKMNTNALGLPKEGYGFSNNVTGAFGPPSFRRASFPHAAGRETVLKIRTRY